MTQDQLAVALFEFDVIFGWALFLIFGTCRAVSERRYWRRINRRVAARRVAASC